MAAIGQSFFALGVGCGNLVVYGSYLDRKKTIGSSTVMVVVGDTVAAILFGLIIFPAAFAFNIEAGMGPPLIFITLPAIFAQMNFGMVFATVSEGLRGWIPCFVMIASALIMCVCAVFVKVLKWKWMEDYACPSACWAAWR